MHEYIRGKTHPYLTDEIPSLWTLIKACYEQMTEPNPSSGKPMVIRPRMIWPRPRSYERNAGKVLYS